MNTVILIGRLTKDVETRYTDKEMSVSNFSIAVKKDYKNLNGEYESDFINCVVFGNGSEYLKKYANKGDLIAVNGRIQTRNYEDKEGNKKYITEVFVNKVAILLRKKEQENEYKDSSIKTETNALESLDVEIQNSDLPF